jgi:hypothetical protein
MFALPVTMMMRNHIRKCSQHARNQVCREQHCHRLPIGLLTLTTVLFTRLLTCRPPALLQFRVHTCLHHRLGRRSHRLSMSPSKVVKVPMTKRSVTTAIVESMSSTVRPLTAPILRTAPVARPTLLILFKLRI